MVVVNRKKGENKDALFRKFTRAFVEEEIIDEVRKRMFYKKPSTVRKEKENSAPPAKKRFRKFTPRMS